MSIGAPYAVPTILPNLEVRLFDQFAAPEITFIGEQDGPAERDLKGALGVLLRLDPTVTRAYLARAVYDGKSGTVMLALLTNGEQDSEKLVAQVGKTFAALFNANANLDIIFLDDEQDVEIRKVCRPFFERKA